MADHRATDTNHLSLDTGAGLIPYSIAAGAVDSAGNVIHPDNYAHVLTYNGDGTVATDAFTDGTNTWTQTYTYTTGNLTGVSKWVKS